MGIGLGTIVTLAGCAPSEEQKEATADSPYAAALVAAQQAPTSTGGVAALQTAAAPATGGEVAPIREGSEPKDSKPFAGAQPAEAEGEGGVDHSITDASAPFGDDKLLAGLVPQGWKQTGPIEHYNVAALYNKINGRSELYMSYDVLGLSWVSFVQEGDADNFVDLFVYDMRTPKSAFGIFSVEREAGQPTAEFGRLSYQTGSNFYFWQGKYYGYVNASRKNDANSTAGGGILLALMQRLEDSGEAISGLDWLPKEGLIQDTIQYFKVDALSLDFLTDTFVGQYQMGDKKVRAFVSRRANEAEAASILTSFGEYCKNYAGATEHITVEGLDITVADWGGAFDGAFQLGPTFAGVSNADSKDTLNAALAMFIKQLKAQG
jgi:hypothetical protein